MHMAAPGLVIHGCSSNRAAKSQSEADVGQCAVDALNVGMVDALLISAHTHARFCSVRVAGSTSVTYSSCHVGSVTGDWHDANAMQQHARTMQAPHIVLV